jgi:hypothetical protein
MGNGKWEMGRASNAPVDLQSAGDRDNLLPSDCKSEGADPKEQIRRSGSDRIY